MRSGSRAVDRETLERLRKDAEVQEQLAADALAGSKKLESYKLGNLPTKTLAAIELLMTKSAWREKLGIEEGESLKALKNTEISGAKIDAVNNWMSDPRNRYEDGKWISSGEEAATETHRRSEAWRSEERADFENAKAEFDKKFGNKLKTWANKGFVVENMDGLVKAYMKDKDLDLITTKDKKVLWGTPKSGFAMKE